MQGLFGRIGAGIILALALSACGGNGMQADLTQTPQSGTTRDISAELRRLEQLEAPEGVASEDFELLRNELRRLLEQYADGKVVARAWCEAVVQRLPEYLDAEDEAWLKQDDLREPANIAFGRRFQLVSFRYLNPSEV